MAACIHIPHWAQNFNAADLVFVNEVPALEEVDLLFVFLISIGFHHTEGILDTVRFVL